MRSMEFSGPTVDAAIFRGLNEMGVTIDEVEIETIQNESKGIFGFGAKEAVVRLTEREIPLEMEIEQVFQKEERTAKRDERYPKQQRTRSEKSKQDRKRKDERREHDSEPVIDPIEYSADLAQTIPAAQFLSEMLGKMGVSASILANQSEEGIRLRIDADTEGLLIGRRGETLDALQYLTSLVANAGKHGDDYVRITLDTEGYRARRESTLRKLARRNAIKVCQTGRSIAMEPMNPYERHVLHSALQNFTGVTTHSEGEEPNRRVVISPTKE